jgi:hypothetical protein
LLTLGYHSYTALKADKKQLTQYLKQRIATQDFSTKPSNLARTFFGINSAEYFWTMPLEEPKLFMQLLN